MTCCVNVIRLVLPGLHEALNRTVITFLQKRPTVKEMSIVRKIKILLGFEVCC